MSNECMSLPTLKPCPFCGEIPKIFPINTPRGGFVYMVYCGWERCEVKPETKTASELEHLIEVWNRRAGESNV